MRLSGESLHGSIRSRFLTVVLLGAVLPLVLAGVWLARSAVRSGEGLLRAQLDTSITTIAAVMERRWDYRRGDLHLLAENDVAVRAMKTGIAATPEDSAFLARLFADVMESIPFVQYRSRDGEVRWQFGDGARTKAVTDSAARLRGTITFPDERFVVSLPVRDTEGGVHGSMDAEVRVAALLPADSVPILVRGARVDLFNHRSGEPIALNPSNITKNDAGRHHQAGTYSDAGETWIAVSRTVGDTIIDVSAAAPTRAYVAPFVGAARLGLLVLVGVTLVAIVTSVYFTARVTRSLAQREALATVGEFATTLSHEVRNGLSAVQVDLQRAEESVSGDTGSTAALVARALRNVQRLNSTVTGSLAVARNGRGRTEAVDMQHVIATAVSAAENAFAKSGATLTVGATPPSTFMVRGDATALEQLLLNLLLNAGQALTPAGRATVTIEGDNETISIAIRDTGAGIPGNALTQAGQPFYTSKPGGTGLGLSIARKIAEGHGGTLEIESAVGEGTVAHIRLPRLTQDTRAAF